MDEVEVRETPETGLVGVLNDMDNEGKFSTLYEGIRVLRLAAILNGSGPSYEYTIFAPNDAAFEAFFNASDLYDDLGDIPNEVLEALLNYHIVAGSVSSSQLGSSLNTLQGSALNISGTTINSNANVVSADLAASNGFVHEIDAVLIPPTFPQNSILEIAGGSDFTSLAAAVGRFPDLVDVLDGGAGDFTVIAPTNAAFSSLLLDLGLASLGDVPDPLLRVILEYHVLGTVENKQEIASTLPTIGGELLSLDTLVITSANINTTNGIVHAINEVQLPPSLETVVGEILFDPDLSFLSAALVKADLTTPLSNGNYTIFAPDDAAFTNAGITSLDALSPEALDTILTYHVVPSALKAADLSSQLYQTLNDAYVTISLSGTPTINSLAITAMDIEGSNGVVHKIADILMPPADNVIETATDMASLSTFVAAVEKAGLTTDLATSSNITVFAPNNDAFNALFNALGVTGLDDITASNLRPLLFYHVIDGRISSSNLPNGEVETLGDGNYNINNETLAITTDSNQRVELTDGVPNIQAVNGMIHIIDKVMQP